jgi:hypothetical protein
LQLSCREMHERPSEPEIEPDAEVALVECVCDGRPRIGGRACDACAAIYGAVLLLLRQKAKELSGNPIWILAWALARVVGSEGVDWDAVRRLAAEFESSELIQ